MRLDLNTKLQFHENSMKSLNSAYLSRIDHIRFLAATLVVFVHTYTLFGGKESSNIIINLLLSGDTGVTLFLVLSGMLFTIISNGGKNNIEYKKFIFNRFVRIFPLLSVAWITAMAISRGTATFSDAMTVLLFSNLQTSPLLLHFGQTWTIAVEFQFYLIFPFLATFLNRYGVKYIISLSIFWLLWRTMIVSIYGGNIGSDNYLNNHYYYLTLLGRLDQLLIGIVFGYLYINFKNLFTNPILLLVSSLFICITILFLRSQGLWYIPTPYVSALSYFEAIAWGFFIICYISSNIKIPNMIDVALSKLGEVSFSEYILHTIVIYSFHDYFGIIKVTQSTNANAIINFLIILPIVLLFSKACFELIEKPFLGFRKKYTNK